MKKYDRFNFFKHTYCEFIEVSEDVFKDNAADYKSKSDSLYHYTKEGVYRYSDHWGRVANCRWRLITNNKYKNQENHLGFAKWTDFYPLNDLDQQFYIDVNYLESKVNFYYEKNLIESNRTLFTAIDAQKRIKHIRNILIEDKWAKYYDYDIDFLRKSIIDKLINTKESLQKIKMELK